MGSRCAEQTRACLDASSAPGTAAEPESGTSAEPRTDTATPAAQGTGVCLAGRYGLDYIASYTRGGNCDLLGLYSENGLGRWYFSLEPSDDPNLFRAGSTNCRLDQADTDGGNGDTESADETVAGGQGSQNVSVLGPRALITGTMNCQSGLLTASLRGAYSAVSACAADGLASDYFYLGTVQAIYVAATGRFEGGTITFKETPSALGDNATAVCSFSAFHVGPGGPLDPYDADCYGGLRFPDGTLPAPRP
jgi:hypothetical protein